MTPADALLILLLLAGPQADVTPIEKAEAADVARAALRQRGCQSPTVVMLEPDGGRERLRAECRDWKP